MSLYLIYLRDDETKIDPRYNEGHFGRRTDCHKSERENIETGDIVVFLHGSGDKVYMEFATEVYVDGGYGLNWDPNYQPYDLENTPIFSISMAKKIRPDIRSEINIKIKNGMSEKQILGDHFRSYEQPFGRKRAEIVLNQYKSKGNKIGKMKKGRAFPGKSKKKC